MIVRDAGSVWQAVLQTDHADLSGQIARRWAALGSDRGSLIVATDRHDDGWAVWERGPKVDAAGRPVNFLDVPVPLHLMFYRACIETVTDHDPYAGLLVSMHGAGIYRERYGTDASAKMTGEPKARALIDAFVAEQEAEYAQRIDALGVSEEQRWADYHLLEIFDRLSLYFCLADVDAGQSKTVGDYEIQPLAPWAVSLSPFPFETGPAEFVLRRRMIEKRGWTNPEFARDFYDDIEPEDVVIHIHPR